MDLEKLNAGVDRALRRRLERVDHMRNAGVIQGPWNLMPVVKGDRTRSIDRRPSTFTRRQGMETLPRSRGARLSPRMPELHAEDRAGSVLTNETADPRQHLQMLVSPDAEI